MQIKGNKFHVCRQKLPRYGGLVHWRPKKLIGLMVKKKPSGCTILLLLLLLLLLSKECGVGISTGNTYNYLHPTLDLKTGEIQLLDTTWPWNYGQTVADRTKLCIDNASNGWTFEFWLAESSTNLLPLWRAQSMQMHPNTDLPSTFVCLCPSLPERPSLPIERIVFLFFILMVLKWIVLLPL